MNIQYATAMKWQKLKSFVSMKILLGIQNIRVKTGNLLSSTTTNLGIRFQRYSDTLPLALKWSLIISAFVSLVMGSLGWYLISQQAESFRIQSELLGQVVADQLSSAASEPLLASDTLTLEVLVSQQKKHALISGMEIYDLGGKLKASVGVSAAADIKGILASPSMEQKLNWETSEVEIVSFFSPIKFNRVIAGLAVVSIDRRPLEQHLNTLTRALLTTTFGLILVGVLLAIPLAYKLASPIDDLVKVGEALDSGHSGDQGVEKTSKNSIGRILTTFNRMGKHLDKKKQVETAFSRHMSASIAREVLDTPEGSALGGNLLEGSVLFCDIVGFTELSEDMNPRDVAALLNQYFSYFSIAAQNCQGTVDKFIGDCIMILFGVPEPDEQHGMQALTCAILIQEIAKRINIKREQEGVDVVKFRLGVNSGEMLAGNLGSEERMQYTVVGDSVNLASRMCTICKPGEVLASESTMRQPSVAGSVQSTPMEPVAVRGRHQLVTPYTIRLHNFDDLAPILAELKNILPDRLL